MSNQADEWPFGLACKLPSNCLLHGDRPVSDDNDDSDDGSDDGDVDDDDECSNLFEKPRAHSQTRAPRNVASCLISFGKKNKPG